MSPLAGSPMAGLRARRAGAGGRIRGLVAGPAAQSPQPHHLLPPGTALEARRQVHPVAGRPPAHAKHPSVPSCQTTRPHMSGCSAERLHPWINTDETGSAHDAAHVIKSLDHRPNSRAWLLVDYRCADMVHCGRYQRLWPTLWLTGIQPAATVFALERYSHPPWRGRCACLAIWAVCIFR